MPPKAAAKSKPKTGPRGQRATGRAQGQGIAAAIAQNDSAAYRERLRTTLLRHARDILEHEGLSALQARRIAIDAKCSVGTVYNIFGDLDGLIVQANHETLTLMGAELSATYAVTKPLPVRERLTALALAYMHFALENRARWRAIFDHRPTGDTPLPEHYEKSRRDLLDLLAEAISPIGGPDLRARAARALFAATHGIVLLALDHKLAPFDAATVEADIEFIVAATVDGLTARATAHSA